MLVSHPKTVSAIAAVVEGVLVREGVSVMAVAVVPSGVTLAVCVLMFGVGEAVAAPITTGVAVNTDGNCVNGKKGVGALPGSGWMIHPLHDASNSAISMKGVTLLILSPPLHCILDDGMRIVPYWWFRYGGD